MRVHRTLESASSIIAFGEWRGQAVVLKVSRQSSDEWNAGAIAAAFDGRGMVRVHEHAPGAVLMDALRPGTPLVRIAERDDDRATRILADVMRRLHEASPPTAGIPAAEDWGRAFYRYEAGGDHRIPEELVRDASRRYDELCATQTRVRLLHGDLQHYNILHDDERGWTAIDPKGVVAEPEFEAGAMLRNPVERPDLWSTRAGIARRITRLEGLDRERMIGWAFAQAVLSMIWTIEDGGDVDPGDPRFALASVMRSLA